MVSEPPFSILPGCTEEPFGFLKRVRFNASREDLSRCRDTVLYQPGPALVIESRRMTTSCSAFNKPFSFFKDDIGNFGMPFSRFIKCRRYNFCINVPLHICNFFRSFIDKKDDKKCFRMVISNSVCDFLEDNRFNRFLAVQPINPLWPLTNRGEQTMTLVVILASG